MKDINKRKKVLEEMIHSRNFERLNGFEDIKQWEQMPTDERELLALLFVMQGEKQLSEGSNLVLNSFKRANQAAPNCPEIMYRQALAFARETHNSYCLKAADRIFKNVVEVAPKFFDAWHAWANTRVLLALHTQSEEDFQGANACFRKADESILLSTKQNQSRFYRDWGVMWFQYGKLSGEAIDFCEAWKYYKKAISLGEQTYDLWNDYGNCLVELSTLLSKPEMILEAVEMYWRSVRLNSDFFEGWMNLATALKVIYEFHPLDAYYTLAIEGFERASRLNPDHKTLWIKWGQLQAFRGKTDKDLDALQDSCRKFEAAAVFDPDHPALLSSWAESLLYIGEWIDDLQLLKQAEEKIITSLGMQSDQPRIWCLYGNCLSELGRYFEDEGYYLSSLEKYQYGSKLSPNDPVIWHGLAMAYFALASFNQEKEYLEKAGDCCRHVIENGGHSQAQYWNDWGVILMKLGTLNDDKDLVEGALNRFEQALRIRSNQNTDEFMEPEWLYNYGCALDFLGDYDEDLSCFEKAIQVLKKVIEIDPSFHHAYYNLAIAYGHYADLTADPEAYHESLIYLEAFVSLEPEDEFAWNEWGLTLIDLSRLIDDPAKSEDVKRLYEEAELKFFYARSLGSSAALYHLACLHSLKGNYDVSLHYLEQAKSLKALPPIEELVSNDWLEGVRFLPEFQKLLSE
jgi:tetratricopeptide (TPR) repeat protein